MKDLIHLMILLLTENTTDQNGRLTITQNFVVHFTLKVDFSFRLHNMGEKVDCLMLIL